MTPRFFACVRLAAVSALAIYLGLAAAAAEPVKLDIPAQPLPSALQLFIKQSGSQVMFVEDEVKNVRAHEAVGEFEPAAALKLLLTDTGFIATERQPGWFAIVRESRKATGSVEGSLFVPLRSGKGIEGVTVTVMETGASTTVDQRGHYLFRELAPGSYTLIAAGEGFSHLRITNVIVNQNQMLTLSPEMMPVVLKGGEVQLMAEVVVSAKKEEVDVMGEYLVKGSADQQPFVGTSNFDIPRTIDDIQPYYKWEGAQIESSGSVDLQDFFQRMVPMDTNRTSNFQQGSSSSGNMSNISLGGLNTNTSGSTTSTQNTLILVNGLPLPPFNQNGISYQANINGIPLAAIDHIEVLPASSSAIYGESAAGGVVNVILRHDYNGVELQATYGNTFNTDAPTKSVALTVGQNLEGGKTNIMVTASYLTEKPLLLQDRLKQVIGPYQARYFSGYPGGELAYLGVSTSGTGYLAQPVVASVSGTPLFAGSSATVVQIPVGYQSFAANGIAPLQANIGNFNLSNPNNPSYVGANGLRFPLNQGPQEKSLGLLLRRQMTSWLELYAQGSNNSNSNADYFDFNVFSAITVPANGPGNPFGQAVKVSGVEATNLKTESPTTDAYNGSIGAKITLPHAWMADLNYSVGETSFTNRENRLDTVALQTASTNGTVNLISDLSTHPFPETAYPEITLQTGKSSLNDLQLKGSGPLMKLWAGTPSLTVGGEIRRTGIPQYGETISQPADSGIQAYNYYFPGQLESDKGAFTELIIPLVGRSNGLFGVKRLDLDAAGRFDSISEHSTNPVDEIVESMANGTFVNSPALANGGAEPWTTGITNYNTKNGTVGLKYKPVDDVIFRISWSTGFVPPTITQVLTPISLGTQNQPTGAYPGVPTTSPWTYQAVNDPLLNATYDVPVKTGGNPNLQPEQSHGLNWGVVFEPKFIKGLRVALDYTRVTKLNDIIAPAVATLIADSAVFPGRVTRGSPNAGQSAGPIVLIDDTDINAPETITSSYNMKVDYVFLSPSTGTWKLSAVANSWQHFEVQSTIGGAFVEQLANPYVTTTGTGAGIAKLKGNLSLDWAKGPFSAGWLARYVGPYTDGAAYGVGGKNFYEVDTINGWVSGQIYHDAYIGFKFAPVGKDMAWWKRIMAGTGIQFGVKNLFGHIPPYDGVAGVIGNGAFFYSPYGDPLLANYYVRLKKTF